MHCPKCDKENPDDAQVCVSCNSPLTSTPKQVSDVGIKRSGMATAALVLGILSLFTFGLTAPLALVLGIISLMIIEKSGGRITGRNFAIAGIVIPVLGLLILIPVFIRIRQKAFRMVCETNMAHIGKGMSIYINDYDNKLPRAGGRSSQWNSWISNWMADNRFIAYGLSADGSGGYATITASLYLLVKYADMPTWAFVCKGDRGTTKFNLADYYMGNMRYIDLWDFGPEPIKNCSYSYHMPYSQYALTSSSEPGMAVAADRNPWIKSPGAEGKSIDIYALFNPDGGKEFVNYGNAIAHQENGQNVLYMDGHVAFEKQPFCAVNDDNIYTYFEGGDIRKGGYPLPNASEPAHRLDSYLVNDAEGGGAPPRKGRGCFLANTPVWVNGSMVEISKVGVSECLATSSIEKLEEHEGSFLCRDIILESGNNISVVDAHCFMLESGKWIAAQNLKDGMRLKAMNGTVVIKNVVTRTIHFVGKVYNLKISNSDRYMVGKDGVIVRDY